MAQDFLNSSDGTLNGAFSLNWYMTLGASNTLKFVNFNPGDVLTLRLIQDGSGSRTVTWPSGVIWQSGSAPTLKTGASAQDVFVFSFDGTNFRDVGGGGSRIPPVVRDAGLTTLIAAGVTGLTLLLSGGNGAHTGNLPAGLLVKNGSGTNAQTLAVIDGSGGYATGASGALATGLTTPGTSRYDSGKFYVSPAGKVVAKNSMSGTSLLLNGFSSGNILCMKTSGSVGKCTGSVGTTGLCGNCQ